MPFDSEILQGAKALFEHRFIEEIRPAYHNHLWETKTKFSLGAQLPFSGMDAQRLVAVEVRFAKEAATVQAESLVAAIKMAGLKFDNEALIIGLNNTKELLSKHKYSACNTVFSAFAQPIEAALKAGIEQDLDAKLARIHDSVLSLLKSKLAEAILLAKAETNNSGDKVFARMAIDEARKSVPENDGRPHPWVGAVVVKDGKVVSTAHRGEVPGNHAEFVALEKNLRDVAVAGATVYTTLEPCTTRTPPKIPCVDRLIERRVGRVVIGILDPDGRIRGLGQRKLSNAGIETALFPHDLAMQVEELNREFTRFCEQQNQVQSGVESGEKGESNLMGDVLQVYAGDDGNHDGNMVVLLRVVSALPTPVTVIDFGLKVTAEDGEVLEGRLDRGDLLDWNLITERKEAARHSPVTSVIKTEYSKLEPALARALENEPLVRGVHKQGWLVFAFPSDDGWAMMEKLEKAKSITLRIVDALKRNYEVPIIKPWNQPGKLFHEWWFR